MDKIFSVAIDGPSGAGKSTIAKAVAEELNIDYIDTGAMYRAVAYKMGLENVQPTDFIKVKRVLDETKIDFAKGDVILDGEIVNSKIRTPEMSQKASEFSGLGDVREKLVELQRKMAETKSVIMDGRDIGTNVLMEAEYKFFMTASPSERAQRRYEELLEKGETVTFDQVLEDIVARDHNDTMRKLNPLKKADDALEVDTTGMSIEEVTAFIIREVRNHVNSKTI
ncbi:MAG: (d)CMP kinase [Anaerovoracaceae bacterium]